MTRILIVNADDCNLTRGVTKAILECHDDGILSSTTFMANLPIEAKTIREIKKRKDLGVGIHLNITLAKPVSKVESVRSLLSEEGKFRKVAEQLKRLPKATDVVREYQAQIDLFRKVFSRYPTHLDTHHQIHNHPFFLEALAHVARKNKLPVRKSELMLQETVRKNYSDEIKTPDHFFGNLSPSHYWRKEWLETLLKNLPEGISEIMCHPGYNDRDLKSITSFTAGRAEELKLFRSPHLKKILQDHSVVLSHYGLCYTWKHEHSSDQ
jgi:chitin disaccharide deacetylase